MLGYNGQKIGERGGFTHRLGDNCHYRVEGFFLQRDGCMVIGIREDDGCIDTGWTEAFNRTSSEVVKQVNRLPLLQSQKLELLQNGIYPADVKIESHQYWNGFSAKGMFNDFLYLVTP